MNLILAITSVVLQGILTMHSGDACYLELGIQGLAEFPSMRKGQDVEEKPVKWWRDKELGHCMLYVRIKPRHTIRMELGDFDLNGYNMTVYVNKYQKYRTWEKFRVFNDSDKNPLLIITDYRAMKIIVREDAQFRFSYKLLFCQVPEGVVSTFCTSDQFRKSICEFACDVPLYSPLEPSSPTFLAKCRRDRKWRVDFSTKCVSIERVKDLCLTIETDILEDVGDTKPDGCNFTDAQLAYFFAENATLGHTPDEMINLVLQSAREKHPGIYVGIVEDGSRSVGVGICFDFCLRNQEGKYHLSCEEQQEWKDKGVCYACRYHYKICERQFIIA